MVTLLVQPVFSVGEQDYRWEDVVAAARASGDWQRLEAETRVGQEMTRRAEVDDSLPTRAEMDEAASAFRYARALLSGDETREWLERWGLGFEAWFDYLRRTLLRDRHELVPEDPGGHVSDQAVWAEVVCSRELERLASELAGRLAVHARSEPGPAALDRPAELEAGLARFRAAAVTPEKVEAEMQSNLLEWTRIDCLWLSTPHEAHAREAAMCVREDGRELSEVAREAGLAAEERRLYMDGIAADLAPHLLGARAGDLLGPLPDEEGFVLIAVRDRAAPSAEDDELRRRAETRIADHAVASEVLSRVRWLQQQGCEPWPARRPRNTP